MHLAIFDVDGTLVRSAEDEDRLFWRALAEVLELDEESSDWTTFTHVTDTGIVDEVHRRQRGAPAPREALARTERHFAALWRERLSTVAAEDFEVRGAARCIEWLRGLPDWRVAIATGGWRASAFEKLTAAGVRTDDLSFGAANDALAREDILEIARQRACMAGDGATFERTVYVGDGVWDARACAALGLPMVGVAVDAAARARLESHGVAPVLQDLADPGAVLEALLEASVPTPE